LALEDKIISILEESPSDQYSLYRHLATAKMSEITKVLAKLQKSNIIHVTRHRKNYRTGLAIPIYSLSRTSSRRNKLDFDGLLAEVTSERIVEYPFLARNLVSTRVEARILDVGSGKSELTETISKFGKKKWQVIGIDIATVSEKFDFLSFIRMDARLLGFRDEIFDQIICLSTIEHIGIPFHNYNIKESDELGDIRAISEIRRVLKKGGTVIATLCYNLIRGFSVIRKEFYRYDDDGKWKKCRSQSIAENRVNTKRIPLYFHSRVCACLLLKK